MLLNLSLFIIFIIFSAFFSASETAIFSLSNVKLRKLSEKDSRGKLVNQLLKKPTRLLSAIVFGNLLVNIGLTSLATAIFVTAFGKNGLILAILASGTIIIFLGEIFPKTFAIYASEKVSLAFSPVLNIFLRLFLPLVIIVELVAKYFSSFIIRGPKKKSSLSDEEFKTAILLSKRSGHISAQEEDMISHVLEFKDTKASEILTARIDIEGLDAKLGQKEALEILCQKKHSKFPVYEGSLDNIVGILHTKDIFLQSDKDYHSLLRKPLLIPESKGIDDILKLFLEKKERIAIVLDEYGGTEGLITLEDIIEEIFGEIYDEFEKAEKPLEDLGQNTWRVRGKTPLRALNLELGLKLSEEEDTIAGFLLSKIERIPRPGEVIKVQTIKFTIERATARRIVSIILKI
jgi:putative hemolysin